jgi:hypothetical protein
MSFQLTRHARSTSWVLAERHRRLVTLLLMITRTHALLAHHANGSDQVAPLGPGRSAVRRACARLGSRLGFIWWAAHGGESSRAGKYCSYRAFCDCGGEQVQILSPRPKSLCVYSDGGLCGKGLQRPPVADSPACTRLPSTGSTLLGNGLHASLTAPARRRPPIMPTDRHNTKISKYADP